MILQVNSDASYLTEPNAQVRIGGHFFLSNSPQRSMTIQLNGTIETVCGIVKHVASSTAKAELGALFHNAREAKKLKQIL